MEFYPNVNNFTLALLVLLLTNITSLAFLKSAKQKLYMLGTPSTLVESRTCKNCIKKWSYTTLLGNLSWYSPTSYISASRVARICLCLYLYLYIIVFVCICTTLPRNLSWYSPTSYISASRVARHQKSLRE